MIARLRSGAIVLLLGLAGSPAAAQAASLLWFDSLDAAFLHAQQFRQPMLIFVGDDALPESRQAWAALTASDATDAERPWTAVRLDADADRPAARSLGVVTAPTLLALTPDGRSVASLNHPASGHELSAWLDTERTRATAASAETDPPTVASLVHGIGEPDPALRESAMRQLRDRPDAAAAVIEALVGGDQQQRLSAIDLLQTWHAPSANALDPWSPTTFTPQRLAALRSWAALLKTLPLPAAPSALISEELNALAAAPTAIAAYAVRQRLLRFGPSILPQVVARLHADPSEPLRTRLLALRYRLVATDRLAAAWPAGFDRIASPDPQLRRQAAAELTDLVDASDAPLLSELFTDDDPFVREQSLKALRRIGGADTNRALVRLLHDPEPNVRAAVLNALTDSPDPALAHDLAQYAQTETDVDLVVHAVQVLELTPGAESFSALLHLLEHPQWRVRGEAAEELLGRLSGNESSATTDDQKTAAYAALEKRLDDPEGYVVTRAAGTLIKAAASPAMHQLFQVADRRPDVARDLLKALANDSNLATPYLPRIHSMAKNAQPAVRCAAISALANLDPNNCGPEIAATTVDPNADVRAAGIQATTAALAALQPSNPPASWFADFRKSANRPAWLSDTAPALLQALQHSDDSTTQVNAAVALCALGKDDQAWPALLHAAASAANAATVAPALPFLPLQRRLTLFDTARKTSPQALRTLLESFTLIPDNRAAARVWQLLGPAATNDDLGTILPYLHKLYTGSDYGSGLTNIDPQRLAAAIDTARHMASTGFDLQRSAALALLLDFSPHDADIAAQAVAKDPRASEWLQLDAFQIRLLAQPQAEYDAATPLAIDALANSAHPALRKVALPFLAVGRSALEELRGSAYLEQRFSESITHLGYLGNQQPILIQPPPGLKPEPLRAILNRPTDNSDWPGYAGYLLVLLGDPSGMDPLMAAARKHNLESPWDQLAYQAIATVNDVSRVPVLTEIYEAMMKNSNYQVREFYWTIRPMTGPAVLKLRKRIRDEYGMAKLR